MNWTIVALGFFLTAASLAACGDSTDNAALNGGLGGMLTLGDQSGGLFMGNQQDGGPKDGFGGGN